MSAKIIPLNQPKRSRWEKLKEGFFRYRKTGVIYYREKFGKLGIPPLNAPTGETTLGRARTAAQQIRADWINKHTGKPTQHSDLVSVREVIEDVRQRYTPTLRRSTQIKQLRFLKDIEKRFGRYSIDSLSSRDLDQWVGDLKRRGTYTHEDGRRLKRTNFADHEKHLNLIARWAYQERMTTHLARFKLKGAKKGDTGRVYTDREIEALWKVMSEETRDKFVLSYECMMRLREALHLTWDRVDLKSGKVTLRAEDVKTGSRTGRGREFILSEHALTRLRMRRLAVKDSRYVFPSPVSPAQPVNEIRNAWAAAKRRAGIKGQARWHDLRHSAISRALLVAGVPPIQVSLYAGVSIATIERVYLHSKAEQTRTAAQAVSIFQNRGKRGVNRDDSEE
jgi:integrase